MIRARTISNTGVGNSFKYFGDCIFLVVVAYGLCRYSPGLREALTRLCPIFVRRSIVALESADIDSESTPRRVYPARRLLDVLGRGSRCSCLSSVMWRSATLFFKYEGRWYMRPSQFHLAFSALSSAMRPPASLLFASSSSFCWMNLLCSWTFTRAILVHCSSASGSTVAPPYLAI